MIGQLRSKERGSGRHGFRSTYFAHSPDTPTPPTVETWGPNTPKNLVFPCHPDAIQSGAEAMRPRPEQAKELLGAIETFRADPQGREALSRVVGAALVPVELGVRDAISEYGEDPASSVELDQYVEDFLATKLGDPKFVTAVVASSEPNAYVRRAAHNLTIDRLRRRSAPPPQAHRPREGAGEADVPSPDSAPSTPDKAIKAEGLQCMRRALDVLTFDDRLLLRVFFSPEVLDEGEVDFLARARNLPTKQIRTEIAMRADRMQAREEGLGESLEERYAYLRELRERRAQIMRAIFEMDGAPVAGAPRGKLEGFVRTSEMRSRSAEWRAGQLAAIDDRIAQYERLADQDRRKAADPVCGRPFYAEVAVVLGRVRPTDSSDAIAIAANTLQVDIGRLLKRLKGIYRELESEDDG